MQATRHGTFIQLSENSPFAEHTYAAWTGGESHRDQTRGCKRIVKMMPRSQIRRARSGRQDLQCYIYIRRRLPMAGVGARPCGSHIYVPVHMVRDTQIASGQVATRVAGRARLRRATHTRDAAHARASDSWSDLPPMPKAHRLRNGGKDRLRCHVEICAGRVLVETPGHVLPANVRTIERTSEHGTHRCSRIRAACMCAGLCSATRTTRWCASCTSC